MQQRTEEHLLQKNKKALLRLSVKFLGGETVNFSNKSLKEVVKECLQYPYVNNNPLVIVSPEMKLYFDTPLLLDWLRDNVIYEDLIFALKTDGLFRNLATVYQDKEEIDPGQLWLKKGKYCFLVDDDQTIILDYTEDRFKEI
ncbi:hypothetical protein [Flavicella sp.]|uniref:hypothetical protein n=1 Tax=Flavicella sp. TaxID=2957742 RepID=UPI00301925E5